MKTLLTLVSALTVMGSLSPVLTPSAWAAEPVDAASAAVKHTVSNQTTVTTTPVQSTAPSVSRRYWVDYGALPRTAAGQVNTATVSTWSVSLPNDDREYLFNPSTRQLTTLSDLEAKDQMPTLLVEMTTNTTSNSVRVCREGARFLGLTALRCRNADLASLPVRNTSSSQVITSSQTVGSSTNTSQTSNTQATATQTTTDTGSQSTVDVALRNVDSTVPATGTHIGALVVTRGWTANHMGTDLALPQQNGVWPDSTGIPVYAIGAPGTKVEVRCWYEPIAGQNASTYAEGMDYAFDFAHLDTCVAGQQGTTTVNAGDIIGTIGNSGAATTGPHLHMQQRLNGTANPITGQHVQAWEGYIERAVSGLGTDAIASNR